jgi:hypothetical protein
MIRKFDSLFAGHIDMVWLRATATRCAVPDVTQSWGRTSAVGIIFTWQPPRSRGSRSIPVMVVAAAV